MSVSTGLAAGDPVTLASLAPLACWVAWQTEDREHGKPTKIPYAPDGRKARADAPKTWGNRDQAEAMAARLPKPYGSGGVGIEFHHLADGRRYGGIDLDTCRDPATGALEDWAQDVVTKFASYTEVSPSETGVKIFFLYDGENLPLLRAAMNGAEFGKQFKRGGGDHPPAIELHLGNRYFAVTDRPFAGSFTEFRHVETSVLLDLIKVTGPAFAGGAPKATPASERQKQGRTSTDRSRSALAFRKGKELRRPGSTFEEMVEGLLADPETADWTREKGAAHSQRELKRIWEKAGVSGPVIRVVAGELHITTTAAEDALIASGLPIYQRGDGLVQPIIREVPASRGRMTLAAGLGEMTVPSVVDVMCATAEYEKFDARSKDWVRINPPLQVAQILLSRQGKWRFPVVAGIITTPTLRPDGSLLTAPGYDPATRLYHVADPSLRLHSEVHAPTKATAERALRELALLLQEFPFVKLVEAGKPDREVSQAVALSALITPVVRGAMSVAPLTAVNAHAPGCGKTFLIDLVSLISTGRPCPVITAAPDEAETEKRIAGLLLAGYPIVSIDNCNGELGGDLLCQAVERPLIRIRRLGGSDITEIESSVSMFATGNNLRVRGDMVRRSLVTELDPQVERPELREFNHDPVATILADRGRYVSACLIIVRAYILAGRPGKLTPIASFEGWSDLVRSALVWLGCADPALSMESAREDDPELGELREMMEVWRNAFGSDAITCKAAIGGATEKTTKPDEDGDINPYGPKTEDRYPELQQMLQQIAGRGGIVDAAKLGRWMLAKEGRIIGKYRFKRDGLTHGSARWKLQSTDR
jgi:hypothetical protein